MTLPFTDEVESAVIFWDEGQASLFDFAIVAATVVGRRNGDTERLAKRIRRDVSTVELYAKGGILWGEALAHYPADSEILRNDLQISFWNAVGSVYVRNVKADHKRFTAGEITESELRKSIAQHLKDAISYLRDANNNGWTVDKLRNMLPNESPSESPFTRAMKRIYKVLDKDIINSPALNSGMDDRQYKRLVRVARMFQAIAKRFVE
jgi:hypothetical protein